MQEQEPLYISKRNRRGVFTLFFVSLALVFTPRILMYFSEEEKVEITIEEIQELDEKREYSQSRKFANFYPSKKDKYNIPEKAFDPNTYSKEQWIKLGLSEKQANVVLKFTRRGINSNEDLKKIFVIPQELYEKIKDSTYYPKKDFTNELQQELQRDRVTINLINLNKGELEEFTKINGIGPFYAKQIIRYRDQLGGFYSKEQLLEVWKMNVETYDKIKDYVFITKGELRQISLNNTNVNELNNHPYLNWNQANSIIKLREQRGGFKSISDIKESVLIDEETFEKLTPYLTL